MHSLIFKIGFDPLKRALQSLKEAAFRLGVQDYEKYLKVKLIICSGHIWYGQKKRNHSS